MNLKFLANPICKLSNPVKVFFSFFFFLLLHADMK